APRPRCSPRRTSAPSSASTAASSRTPSPAAPWCSPSAATTSARPRRPRSGRAPGSADPAGLFASRAQAAGVTGLVVERAAQERLDEAELGDAEPLQLGPGVVGDRPPDLLDGSPPPSGQPHQHPAAIRRVTRPFGQTGPLQPVDNGGGGATGQTGLGRQLARGERAARGQPAEASQVGAVDAEAPGRQFVGFPASPTGPPTGRARRSSPWPNETAAAPACWPPRPWSRRASPPGPCP